MRGNVFEAFGTRPKEIGSTQDRQKANTKDEEPFNLLNEGFRWRDLETGTFLTRDPLGFVDGPNLYSYVNDNPWTKFDPEGLAEYKGGAIVNFFAPSADLVETALTTVNYAKDSNNPTGMRVAAGAVAGVYAMGIAMDIVSPGGKIAKEGKAVLKIGEEVAEKITSKVSKEATEKTLEKSAQTIAKETEKLRREAVAQAWKQEKELVEKTGEGTRRWTEAEKKQLLEKGKIEGYEGHHINSVKGHPEDAGDPNNIKFVKGRKEHLEEHGGNFRNPTEGQKIERKVPVEEKKKE